MRSRRDTIRALARRGADRLAVSAAGGEGDAAASLHVGGSDEGHPLLASLGRVGRDFQQVLESLVDYQDDPCDRYVEPDAGAGATMLATLQADILALRWRSSRGDAAPLALAPTDESIAVHACHGPMREVEVVHDQLLALFDRDATLAPAQVVVMTPSIDAYAPVIEAVFGGAGRPSIPFRIADRRARAQHEVIDAFLHALEVLGGRLPAPAVLDLLAREPVRARFQISADELERVRRWVAESGIRWGADAGHRAELGQPPCADHTWRFGLDRLLLGYALPGDGEALFGGVLPYDDVEGSDAALLGRVAELCARLTRYRDELRRARPPAEWRDTLVAMLADLVAATAANAHQHHAINSALQLLAERAAGGRFSGAVDGATMRALLERELDRERSARGFLTGAVTFCELVPMRTIPFRVVCLLGLDDGRFPRVRRPLGFDRMAAQPQPGDRTARDDDRYLFLEALLAARERLLITYVGQSISDNTELPPSVVVSELLDTIDESFCAGGGGRARDRIVQRHPLQPFSPRYFGRDEEGRLFSYAATYHAGAVALVGAKQPPAPLLSAPLPAEPVTGVAIDDLVRFFDNPSRWFLQRCLGVYLGRDADVLEDREPIELNALDAWRIGDALLGRTLRGSDPAAAWAVLRAGGMLPHGMPGRCAVEDAAAPASALARSAQMLRGGDRVGAEELDVEIGGVRVTGVLRELWPGGQIAVQYAKIGGRHELSLWIRHLARSAAGAAQAHSVLIGRPRTGDGPSPVWFRPVDDPHRRLGELLHLYQLGQRAPLPLFKRASRAFADAMQAANGTRERAWAKARDAFLPNNHGNDADDPYVFELYGKAPPFDADAVPWSALPFADIALAVYGPLLGHREERT
jgi:exodeoxyribonuclease V gamma subunit